MPRPLKWGILGAGTIILSGDIHNFILCMVRIFMNQTISARAHVFKSKKHSRVQFMNKKRNEK